MINILIRNKRNTLLAHYVLKWGPKNFCNNQSDQNTQKKNFTKINVEILINQALMFAYISIKKYLVFLLQ